MNTPSRILDWSMHEKYLNGLFHTFELLSENPGIGRKSHHVGGKYHKHEHAKHVIYYRIAKSDILIARILGAEQDPTRQLDS